MSESNHNELQEITNSLGSSGISRKDFLKYTGMASASVATLGLVGCDDEDNMVGPEPPEPGTVYLGEGDVGVLNYAYALEQLEAAFYIKAAEGGALSGSELDTFKDIRDHEVAHTDFYKAAISAVAPKKIIPGLTPDFSKIDFNSKSSVVSTALTFENVGVSAYNGAGKLLKNKDFLLVAGKIVSVEARHAAAISDIARPSVGVADNQLVGNMAGSPIIDNNGLDMARSVSQVYGIVNPFIKEKLDPSGLPQS